VLFLITQLLVGACMVLLLWGSWAQVEAGLTSYSTVLGYPLALGAAATLVLAVGMLVVVLRDLRRGHPQGKGDQALDIE
jgi:TRAP-type C4-dicarboxylate transport system permease small subunit